MSTASFIATLSLSLIFCILSFGAYLWTSSISLLTAFVLSSCTALLTYVLGFLIVAYKNKTGNDEFNMGCCNVFNLAMMMIYVLFIASFFATFCGLIHSFVKDAFTQYILYSAYGFVLLIIIVSSFVVFCAKRPMNLINDVL